MKRLLKGAAISSWRAGARDSFVRADSSTTLGTADKGGAWTAGSIGDAAGMVFGISGNKGYCVAAGATSAPHAWLECAKADGALSASVLVSPAADGQALGLMLRRVNSNNYFDCRIHRGLGTVVLRRVLAGVLSTIGSSAVAQVDGQTIALKVVMQGSLLVVLCDGVEKIRTTDANMTTGTKHGLGTSGATSGRWTNFRFVRR